jgi:multidrug resistance efflux pump
MSYSALTPQPFALALQQAEAKLAGVGQSIGASTAAVSSAQERLIEAKAQRDNVREQASRILELVEKGVYAKARADTARKRRPSRAPSCRTHPLP